LRTTLKWRLQEAEQRIDLGRLRQALKTRLAEREQNLRRLAEKLHLLSPLATLSRGFAIAIELPDRRVVKNASDVPPGTMLEISVNQGRIYAQTQRTES
jgi:exodeoxyribonuclease VII large subunit